MSEYESAPKIELELYSPGSPENYEMKQDPALF